MSVKGQQRTEKYLLAKINELKERLYLQGYHDPKLVYSKEMDGAKSFMTVEDNYPYRFINIRYGDDVIKSFIEGDFKIIDRMLTHELIHIVLSHFYNKGATRSTSKELDDALEDTVEHITRIVTR